MNKITKIGVLGVALLTLTTALFTKAAEDGSVTKKVSLVLNDGQNTCTLLDYNLGTKTVTPGAQPVAAVDHDASCTILKASPQHIEIGLEHLKNGATSGITGIKASNFTGVISSLRLTGSLQAGTTPTFNMGETKNVYSKGTGQVGIWTGNLAINGTIPAGTPAGTYSGNLNISVIPGYGS